MVPALSLQSSPDSTEPGELGQIVARAARGEEPAWETLVGLYSRRVFAMARSRLHDDELAEEITQSVFVTVALKLGQSDPNGTGGGYSEQGRFEPWLFRITMNRVRDLCRARSRHATPMAPEHMAGMSAKDEPGVHEADQEKQQLDRLRAAMEQLNQTDREVIELRHHGQLSFKQIAHLTGDPIGTLLARHHRALKKLRTIIDESSPGTAQATPPDNHAPQTRSGESP